MRLEDVLETPLVVSPEDTISKVASRMLSEKKREAVVLDGEGDFRGVVLAKDIVRKKVSEPHKTTIGVLVKEINPLLPGTELDEIVNAFMVNGYRTVPVKSGGEIKVLNRMSLLKLVRGDPAFKGKTAEDAMNFPYCVSVDDSLSTTRAIFKEMNISRVPVLKEGKVEGVINIIDLLGPVYSAELDKRDNMPEDTTRLDGVLAASFMRKDFPVVEPAAPLSQVIDLMLQKRSAVIVEKGGRLAGMVTSGDLLKLLGREVKGAYVSISGFQEEDDFLKSFIYEEIGNLLRKVNKIYPVNYLNAHLDKYFSDTERKRIKYSFRVRLATGGGFFFAHDYAWDLTKAMKGALEKLDKEIIKRKERLANL